jgi:hypothetical protein
MTIAMLTGVVMVFTSRRADAQSNADAWLTVGQWRSTPLAEKGCRTDGRLALLGGGASLHRQLWKRIGSEFVASVQGEVPESGDACLSLPPREQRGDTVVVRDVVAGDVGAPGWIAAIRASVDLYRRRADGSDVGLRLLGGPGLAVDRGTLRLGLGADMWAGSTRLRVRAGVDHWRGDTRLIETRTVRGVPVPSGRFTHPERIWLGRLGLSIAL